MNLQKFTEKAQQAILATPEIAREFGHASVEPEHLLVILAEQEGGVVPAVLRKLTVDPAGLAACPTTPETSYALTALGSVAGRRVLDLGCGYGETAAWLALQGASVEAVDISPGMVEVSRRLAAACGVEHRIRFHVGPGESLPLETDSVDAAFGHDVRLKQVPQRLGLLDGAVDDVVGDVGGDSEILQSPQGLDEAAEVRSRLHGRVHREPAVVFVLGVHRAVRLLAHPCTVTRSSTTGSRQDRVPAGPWPAGPWPSRTVAQQGVGAGTARRRSMVDG